MLLAIVSYINGCLDCDRLLVRRAAPIVFIMFAMLELELGEFLLVPNRLRTDFLLKRRFLIPPLSNSGSGKIDNTKGDGDPAWRSITALISVALTVAARLHIGLRG